MCIQVIGCQSGIGSAMQLGTRYMLKPYSTCNVIHRNIKPKWPRGTHPHNAMVYSQTLPNCAPWSLFIHNTNFSFFLNIFNNFNLKIIFKYKICRKLVWLQIDIVPYQGWCIYFSQSIGLHKPQLICKFEIVMVRMIMPKLK